MVLVLLYASGAAADTKNRSRGNGSSDCTALIARATSEIQKANENSGEDLERLLQENEALRKQIKKLKDKGIYGAGDLPAEMIE